MNVKKTAIVPQSAESMFKLINSVDQYPEFLPWCGGSRILESSSDSMTAEITISFKGIRQSFTTQNDLSKPGEKAIGIIRLNLVKGPFRSLHGAWEIVPLGPNGCKIDFGLDYQFSNSLLERALSPVFKQIAETFVDSFVKRADEVYVQ